MPTLRSLYSRLPWVRSAIRREAVRRRPPPSRGSVIAWALQLVSDHPSWDPDVVWEEVGRITRSDRTPPRGCPPS